MSSENFAVLLLAFGGPSSLDDIESFMGNILSGRRLSSGLLSEITERYRKIGGSSPLSAITSAQAKALEESLNRKGFAAKVYSGMRYWHPFIRDTLKAIADDGHKKVVSLIMAPHYSGYTVNGYRHDLDKAIAEFSLGLELSFITDWYDNRLFQQAVSEKIKKELTGFNAEKKTVVIFTPHSLPVKFMKPNDPYVSQIKASIEGVIGFFETPVDWRLAYQSKGAIPGEWLGPPLESVLERLPGEGCENVLIVPVGFCSDHVETLYDVDIVYREKAQKLGLNFARSDSLNTTPMFIEGLSEVVLEKVKND